jgi:flagellar FliL protein
MATTLPELTPKSRKRKRLFLALLGITILTVAAAAAAAAVYLVRGRAQGAAVAPPPAPPIFISLEPLTVNLQSSGRSRFLHVGLTFKAEDDKSQARVTEYLPEVRSRILTLLSNRDADSLLTPADKTRLAAEILAAVNQPFAPTLPPQRISSVMFTAFVLQ